MILLAVVVALGCHAWLLLVDGTVGYYQPASGTHSHCWAPLSATIRSSSFSRSVRSRTTTFRTKSFPNPSYPFQDPSGGLSLSTPALTRPSRTSTSTSRSRSRSSRFIIRAIIIILLVHFLFLLNPQQRHPLLFLLFLGHVLKDLLGLENLLYR